MKFVQIASIFGMSVVLFIPCIDDIKKSYPDEWIDLC